MYIPLYSVSCLFKLKFLRKCSAVNLLFVVSGNILQLIMNVVSVSLKQFFFQITIIKHKMRFCFRFFDVEIFCGYFSRIHFACLMDFCLFILKLM